VNALARAIATATPNAIHADSDVANRSEAKGSDLTSPDLILVWARYQDQRLTQVRRTTALRPRVVLPVIGLGGQK
jgi:hypothetical protein